MRIVKVKWGRLAEFEAVPGFIYCGRGFGGYPPSPLGNPFRPRIRRVGNVTYQDVAGTLDRYRDWLVGRLSESGPAAATFARITEESVLGCWCCDKDEAGTGEFVCHCDVIAAVWRENLSGIHHQERA